MENVSCCPKWRCGHFEVKKLLKMCWFSSTSLHTISWGYGRWRLSISCLVGRMKGS